jgi:hypothetical protein
MRRAGAAAGGARLSRVVAPGEQPGRPRASRRRLAGRGAQERGSQVPRDLRGQSAARRRHLAAPGSCVDARQAARGSRRLLQG